MSRHRLLLLSPLFCALLFAAVLWGLTWKQTRQARLDRELLAAIETNDSSAVLKALQHGGDSNTRAPSPSPASFWRILPGHVAGSQPPYNVPAPSALEVAVRNGEDSNSAAAHAADPTHYRYVGAENVALLLKHGAKVPVRDAQNDALVLDAVDKPAIMAQLLQHGANPNVEDGEGNSPLDYAAFNHDTDIARSLLDHGAKVNRAGQNRRTPLLNAVRGSYASGFGQHSAEDDAHEAVQIARLAALLLDRGADINAQDEPGHDTALKWAAERHYVPVVRLLLRRHARIDMKDDEGVNLLEEYVTPPSSAQGLPYSEDPADQAFGRRQHQQIARMLRAAGVKPPRTSPAPH